MWELVLSCAWQLLTSATHTNVNLSLITTCTLTHKMNLVQVQSRDAFEGPSGVSQPLWAPEVAKRTIQRQKGWDATGQIDLVRANRSSRINDRKVNNSLLDRGRFQE